MADKSSNRIYKFNRDGKFIRSIGGPGEGPGEFNSSESIAVTENELIVYDFRSLKIVFFDKVTGKEIRVLHLKGFGQTPMNKVVKLSDEIVILGFRYNSNDLIHSVNTDGELIHSTGEFIDFGSFQHSINGKQQLSYLHFSEFDDLVLVGTAAPNRLKLFDSDFNLISEFEKKDLPVPWETHMKMRAGSYETRFYSMGLHNQLLNSEYYLFNWIEVNEESPNDYKNWLELRRVGSGDVVAAHEFPSNSQLLGMKKLSDGSIISVLREPDYKYAVYLIELKQS